MFKNKIIFILLAMTVIIFVSCSNVDNNINENPLLIDPLNPGQYGTQIWNVTDWSQVIDYNGEPITLEVSLDNVGDKAEYGIILFVDGIQTLFTTNEHNEFGFMHVFHLDAQEKDRTITVTFSPDFMQNEDTVAVNISTILNPNHKLDSLDFISYLMHHSLLQASPYHMKINTFPKRKVLISNDFDKEEIISQELEEEYIHESVKPESSDDKTQVDIVNELDNSTQFKLYQGSLDSIEDCYTVQNGKDLLLNLACLGKSDSYRISFYINHKIVSAFDGKNYFDIKVEREKVKTKHIIIPASVFEDFDEFNHIYFIAIPLEQGETASIFKSQTKILHIFR